MTPPTSMWTGAVYLVGVAGHGTPDILLKCPFGTVGEDAGAPGDDRGIPESILPVLMWVVVPYRPGTTWHGRLEILLKWPFCIDGGDCEDTGEDIVGPVSTSGSCLIILAVFRLQTLSRCRTLRDFKLSSSQLLGGNLCIYT